MFPSISHLFLRWTGEGKVFIQPYRVTGQNGSGQNGTDKMVWTKWYGQNGMGQNGMDKMAWTKWYEQNGMDKMAWTKWYEENGMDKMV